MLKKESTQKQSKTVRGGHRQTKWCGNCFIASKFLVQLYKAENFGLVELPNNENLEDFDSLILFQCQKSSEYKHKLYR